MTFTQVGEIAECAVFAVTKQARMVAVAGTGVGFPRSPVTR